MIIFLDFDGVLRRVTAPPYRLEADCLKFFENAVRKIPGVRLVISSSWREAFSLQELRALFSGDVARLVIGVLPADDPSVEYPRHTAVLAYLKAAGLRDETWIAVDDCATHFPVGCRNLVLVDGALGFDSKAAKRLAAKSGYPNDEPLQ